MEGEMYNAEIQRLWDENQRLMQERDITQYELGIAREELRRKDLMINDIRAEHEIHCIRLMKRGLKLVEEIPATGPLKNEVKCLQSEVTRICAIKQDLSSQLETVTKDLARLQVENKQIPSLKAKINRLHHHLVQSGQKKMVTFCSKVLQQLDYGLVHCQVLILAYTCERAHQIEKLMRELGGRFGVKIHACVGDNSIEEDKRILSVGVHLFVGTPWCVLNLLCTQDQSLHPDLIRMLVLDEANEMLSRGFDVQIHNILSLLPAKVKVIALYPTMPEEDPLEIMRKLMNKQEVMNLWQSIVFC